MFFVVALVTLAAYSAAGWVSNTMSQVSGTPLKYALLTDSPLLDFDKTIPLGNATILPSSRYSLLR